jgi:regulator of replication initiation timing
MSIAMTVNILTMLLCAAVMIQSVRMMRSLRKVKDGALTDVVKALDTATVQARAVLQDMKRTLSSDCAENARLVAEARGLRDELSVMIGIADAAAERIVGAVGAANAGASAARDEQEEEQAAQSDDEEDAAETSARIDAIAAALTEAQAQAA